MGTPGEATLPRVQVLILTYNRADVVERAIMSALAQDYSNLEILVVDNGSTDNTSEVLARYADDQRIRVVRYDDNRGSGGGRNRCIEHSMGEYALFLDSDDELLPGAVRAMVQAAEERKGQIAFVMADCVDGDTGQRTGVGLADSCVVTYADAIQGAFAGEFINLFPIAHARQFLFEEGAYGSESIVWYTMMKERPCYYLQKNVRIYHKSRPDRISLERFLDTTTIGRKRRAYEAYMEHFGSDLALLAPTRLRDILWAWSKWEQLAGKPMVAWRLWLQATRIGPLRRACLTGLVRLLLPRRVILHLQQYR